MRRSDGWPRLLGNDLLDRGVEVSRSVLIAEIPDQGFLSIVLLDQARRVVEFELEYTGAHKEPLSENEYRIVEWTAQPTDGTTWWWKEHERMTQPKPNNPIAVALDLLSTDLSA